MIKDLELEALLVAEKKRQSETLDLIASENIASNDMMEVVGSVLMNKYSEGYPGKRYYPGNAIIDRIEQLAINRALAAFDLSSDEWHVNVQPYSGSPANFAIYSALMMPGDVLTGMELASGGHLTHGHKVSFTGKYFKSVQYGLDPFGRIDFDGLERIVLANKPRVIVSGLTAYPRAIDFARFGEIASKNNAYHVADISHIAGLVLAGLHPSPFTCADVVMMTTHKTLRGPRGAIIFCKKDLGDKIDKAIFPGMQGGPHDNITAAKALMFNEAITPEFYEYQSQIILNARMLAEVLEELNPGSILTGGTDNHMMLLDVRFYGIDGAEAEKRLEQIGILANRNTIPGDPSPFKPSGIRIGVPAITSRGMAVPEMKMLGAVISEALSTKDALAIKDLQKVVSELCRLFPLKSY